LLTAAPALALVGQALPEDVHVHAAGMAQLIVVERPQPPYHFSWSIQLANFPPPRLLPPSLHNLPLQLNSFIGRDREQIDVAELLTRSPLVTLIGAAARRGWQWRSRC
jgi:hypothetical protein